jgi:hypothetical protein
VLLAVAVALFAPYRHFTTDDAFIHFQFARNLAGGRGFSYNADQPTYGDTSPLWVFMLAGTGRLLEVTGVAPAASGTADAWRLAAKLLNALSLLAALVVFVHLARRRLPRPRWAAAVVIVLFVLDPWWIKWGMAGMETPLAVMLALLALLLRDVRRNSGRSDPWTPLVLGIGYLVRPEFAILIVALIADVLIVERRRRRADLMLAVCLPALPIVPWLGYALATFGTPLPDTFAARRDVNYSSLYVAVKLGKILASAYAVPLASLLIGLVAAGDGRARRLREDLFPFAAITMVLLFYLFWNVSVGARYVLLIAPYLVLVGYAWLFGSTEHRPRLRTAALAFSAAALIGVQITSVRFVTRWQEGLDGDLFALARWLEAETPPGAVVAAHEIGVIGYVSQRRVLDLAALISPDVMPFSRTGSVARSIGDRQVDYLGWNSNDHPDEWLLRDMEGRLTPMLTREVHREGSSHRGGWQYYTVYAVSE